MHKNIVMLGTFDTKDLEFKYLYDELVKRDVDVIAMNAGVMGSTERFMDRLRRTLWQEEESCLS